jgi:hypothetical protein
MSFFQKIYSVKKSKEVEISKRILPKMNKDYKLKEQGLENVLENAL